MPRTIVRKLKPAEFKKASPKGYRSFETSGSIYKKLLSAVEYSDGTFDLHCEYTKKGKEFGRKYRWLFVPDPRPFLLGRMLWGTEIEEYERQAG